MARKPASKMTDDELLAELKPTVSAPALTAELASEFVADQNAEAAGLVPVGISINRRIKRGQTAKAVRVNTGLKALRKGHLVDRSSPASVIAATDYSTLHPTKGWRRFTAKRVNVFTAMAQQRELWGTIFGKPEASTARDAKPVVVGDLPPDTMTRQRRRAEQRKAVAHG